MPDVFLSYSHRDRETARRVAERFEAAGWTSWWDQSLVPGETWAEVTRAELRTARVVLALWSEASWGSRWVQAEAYAGYETRRLVCARLDGVIIEPPFNIMQTADLRAPDGLERLVAGVARAMGESPGPARPNEAPASRRRVRLAVMPFENLSPDPANAFFADGMHEQVLSSLATAARGLEVISRTTMMSFRGRGANVGAIREELKCTHLLEGTVRREGDAVRLTVQLIDAGADQHLWSEDFDRTLTNALALQSEVATEVASRLFIKLKPVEALGPAPVDPGVYDLYLKARIGRQSLGAVADPMPIWRDIEEQLTEAIARDSSFAPAYVERAVGAWYCFMSNFDTRPERLEQMRGDLKTLETLSPQGPATIAVKGLSAFADQHYQTALQLFTQAEDLGLVDADLLQWKAFLLTRLGRQDEARVIYDRLISLDPGNLFLLLFVLTSEMAAKRPDQCERIIDLGLTRSPGNIIWFALRANLKALFSGETADRAAMFDLLYQNMTAANFDPDGFIAFYLELLIFAGRFDEALAALEQSGRETFIMIWYASLPVAGLGRFPLAVARGKINLLLGRLDEARADGDRCLDFHARQTPMATNAWALQALKAYGLMLKGAREEAQTAARLSLELALALPDTVHRAAARHLAAGIFALTGGAEEAAALLEAAYDASPGVAPIYVVADPGFAMPLRETPRYLALVARANADMAKARGA